MYPLNLTDFLFKEGVQVMSANEVLAKKRNFRHNPNFKQYPYLSNFCVSPLTCNEIQNEMVFTN